MLLQALNYSMTVDIELLIKTYTLYKMDNLSLKLFLFLKYRFKNTYFQFNKLC